MGIFPKMGQRSKVILPIRSNLQEYNEIPEVTTITANTYIPSVQDGPTVIARYRNLVIGAGVTLTPQYRCCGMVLVVDGDLTVNGTISMTARGANFAPANDHRIKNDLLPGNNILYEIDIPATADEIAAFLLKEKKRYHSMDELPAIFRPTLYCRGSKSGIYTPADLASIPVVGGAGGPAGGGVPCVYSGGPGIAGANGTNRQCGGGGGGGSAGSYRGSGWGGYGTAGTCYSGGSGGAAVSGAGTYAVQKGLPEPFGGRGGNAIAISGESTGGGAGNPAGTSAGTGSIAPGEGTGGLLIIICTGDIIIPSTGKIEAKGAKGGDANPQHDAYGGGGSGGGSINIFHGGALTNNGSISVVGGIAGDAGSGLYNGGKGGDGCVTTDHYNF